MALPHAWLWFLVIIIFSYPFVSLFPSSYHKLMVTRYRSKREKVSGDQTSGPLMKQKSLREMESYGTWSCSSGFKTDGQRIAPHCLVIMYKMFRHAAAKGWKEAEHIVCRGCWQTLPQLNPEVGLPAVQLVGLEMTKEELLEIYLEVYKLHRLPGSPPGEPGNTRGSAVLPPKPPKAWRRGGPHSHSATPCWRPPIL